MFIHCLTLFLIAPSSLRNHDNSRAFIKWEGFLIWYRDCCAGPTGVLRKLLIGSARDTLVDVPARSTTSGQVTCFVEQGRGEDGLFLAFAWIDVCIYLSFEKEIG